MVLPSRLFKEQFATPVDEEEVPNTEQFATPVDTEEVPNAEQFAVAPVDERIEDQSVKNAAS